MPVTPKLFVSMLALMICNVATDEAAEKVPEVQDKVVESSSCKAPSAELLLHKKILPISLRFQLKILMTSLFARSGPDLDFHDGRGGACPN